MSNRPTRAPSYSCLCSSLRMVRGRIARDLCPGRVTLGQRRKPGDDDARRSRGEDGKSASRVGGEHAPGGVRAWRCVLCETRWGEGSEGGSPSRSGHKKKKRRPQQRDRDLSRGSIQHAHTHAHTVIPHNTLCRCTKPKYTCMSRDFPTHVPDRTPPIPRSGISSRMPPSPLRPTRKIPCIPHAPPVPRSR